MLIKDEKIESVLEYAEEKIIASIYPTDMLIIHNWALVRILHKL